MLYDAGDDDFQPGNLSCPVRYEFIPKKEVLQEGSLKDAIGRNITCCGSKVAIKLSKRCTIPDPADNRTTQNHRGVGEFSANVDTTLDLSSMVNRYSPIISADARGCLSRREFARFPVLPTM